MGRRRRLRLTLVAFFVLSFPFPPLPPNLLPFLPISSPSFPSPRRFRSCSGSSGFKQDLNGNHVIQKCLNRLTSEQNQVRGPRFRRWRARLGTRPGVHKAGLRRAPPPPPPPPTPRAPGHSTGTRLLGAPRAHLLTFLTWMGIGPHSSSTTRSRRTASPWPRTATAAASSSAASTTPPRRRKCSSPPRSRSTRSPWSRYAVKKILERKEVGWAGHGRARGAVFIGHGRSERSAWLRALSTPCHVPSPLCALSTCPLNVPSQRALSTCPLNALPR